MNALEQATKVQHFVKNFREDLHMYPELSGKEVQTQKKIIAELEQHSIPYVKVGNTSIVATIDSGKPGKVIGLRSDMDALPMTEECDEKFISKTPGVAHTCGHDVHSSILLGAAIILNDSKDSFNGKVKCIFQEAEETLSGAVKVIESGQVNDVQLFFALHCMPLIESGMVSIMPGYQLTGSDMVKISWIGVSGHGSMPHLANDSIHAAAVFVADLQSAIHKSISPQEIAVATVCKFTGGTTFNIISKYTELEMTLRYYSDDVQKIMHDQIKKHATHIGDMYGVKAVVDITKLVKGTYNDPEVVSLAKKSFSNFSSEEKIVAYPPIMSSEDFSMYSSIAPSAMGWLGCGNKEKGCIYYPHHEKFKVDDASFPYGVAWLCQVAFDFLG